MEFRADGRGGRLLAFLLTLVIVGLSSVTAFLGTLYGFGLKCDDLCSNTPGSWSEDRDAWQWSALGWSSVGLFGCALLLCGALIARRGLLAWLAAGGWVVIGVAFLVLLDGSSVR